MTNQTETNYAEQQAQSQVDSIVALMAAFDCDFDQLDELREQRSDWMDEHANDAALWATKNPNDATELAALEAKAGEYDDQADVADAISDTPLSIEVRSAWTTLDDGPLTPSEYRIVLCTGAPHVELVGDLDCHDEPDTVRVIYKDWDCLGELFDFDRDAVLRFARFFQYNIG